MPLTKLMLIAPTAALGLLILAGCGSSTNDHDMGSMPSPASSAPPATAAATPASGPHNEADVRFAAMMIPHHNQAIEMSDILLAKADADPKVTALARKINAAQGPEVAQMTGWLLGWGEDPSTGGMHHGVGDGMMSQAEMDALRNATGPEATQLFLDGMIKHHTGAIAMARTELKEGSNPDAKKLAQAIIDTQEAEITAMKQLGGR
jgi:uncharacterized protein (DUF305 family)